MTVALNAFFGDDLELQHVDSVRAAYWAVSENEYDLIVLDMALPTFTGEGESAAERGHDQAQGGVEVLRALKARKFPSKVVIITQYPDIKFGGERLKLSEAPRFSPRDTIRKSSAASSTNIGHRQTTPSSLPF